MPKINRKKSKRMTIRKKHKIIKRVAEHNRKARREAKKNATKKKFKDPGIPNSVPFKEEILHEAEQRKQRAKDLREAQKASRLKLQLENRGLEELVDEANEKTIEFSGSSKKEKELKSSSTNFKSYFKDLKKVIESADVILEVLDARDPLGSRCPQIEEMVISSGKKLVLVMNKIDLIPRSNLEEWLKFLRQELPVVAFKASRQLQIDNLSQANVAAIHINDSLQKSKKCVGASFLMKVLGNYCRNENIQTSITVGVVGFPNVGKSSVINSLKRSRSCTVGAVAGVTKSIKKVSLDKHIKILDCPGIIFAKDGSPTTLALRNAVKLETLNDLITPAEAIVERADHTQLCLHYTVPEFSSCHELLCMLAKRMGRFKKGGIPHYEEGARKLINDWNHGIIKYYTQPPEEYKPTIHIDSTLVTEMSKAFDISNLEEKEQMELDKSPEIFPSKGVSLKSAAPTECMLFDAENMDVEDTSSDAHVTVSFPPAKTFQKNEIASDVSIVDLQQNKLLKKKFKQMKRNRKKMEKLNSNEDSFDENSDVTEKDECLDTE